MQYSLCRAREQTPVRNAARSAAVNSSYTNHYFTHTLMVTYHTGFLSVSKSCTTILIRYRVGHQDIYSFTTTNIGEVKGLKSNQLSPKLQKQTPSTVPRSAAEICVSQQRTCEWSSHAHQCF